METTDRGPTSSEAAERKGKDSGGGQRSGGGDGAGGEGGKPIFLQLGMIECDESFKVRQGLDEAVVQDYADRYRENPAAHELPPVTVWKQPGCAYTYPLLDGWHRVEAARRAGLDRLLAVVKDLPPAEALRFALGANARHGHRMTQEDIRRAIKMALADPELGQLSDRNLATLLGTTHPTVAKHRAASAAPADREPADPAPGTPPADAVAEASAEAEDDHPATPAPQTESTGPQGVVVLFDDGCGVSVWYSIGATDLQDSRVVAMNLPQASYGGVRTLGQKPPADETGGPGPDERRAA